MRNIFNNKLLIILFLLQSFRSFGSRLNVILINKPARPRPAVDSILYESMLYFVNVLCSVERSELEHKYIY